MSHAPRVVTRALAAGPPRSWCRRSGGRASHRPLFAVGLAGGVLAPILGFGLHVNFSSSAPRGLYRTVTGAAVRGAWVVVCVSADAAALARARGYLRPGTCASGVQPILKPVVAVAGDIVEIRPEAVIVNGQRLPVSRSAAVDGLGHSLPHAAWGRHVVEAGEVWIVSTRVPNSWDSRYLGPMPTAQILSVARPVWTVD